MSSKNERTRKRRNRSARKSAARRLERLGGFTPADPFPDWEAFFAGPFPRFDGTVVFPGGPALPDPLEAALASCDDGFPSCGDKPPVVLTSPARRVWRRRLPTVLESLHGFALTSDDPLEWRALEQAWRRLIFEDDENGTVFGPAYPHFPPAPPAGLLKEATGKGRSADAEDDEDFMDLARRGSLIATFVCVAYTDYESPVWPVKEMEALGGPAKRGRKGARYACGRALLERGFEPYANLLALYFANNPDGRDSWDEYLDAGDALMGFALERKSPGALVFLAKLLLTDRARLDMDGVAALVRGLAGHAERGLWPALQAWGLLAARIGTAALTPDAPASLFRELLADAVGAGIPDAFALAGDPDLFFLTGNDGFAVSALLRRGMTRGSLRAHLQAARFNAADRFEDPFAREAFDGPSVTKACDLADELSSEDRLSSPQATFANECLPLRRRFLSACPWDVRDGADANLLALVRDEDPELVEFWAEEARDEIFHTLTPAFDYDLSLNRRLLYAFLRVLAREGLYKGEYRCHVLREDLLDAPGNGADPFVLRDALEVWGDARRRGDPFALFHADLLALERAFLTRPRENDPDVGDSGNARIDLPDPAVATADLVKLAEKGLTRARVLLARAHRYGLLGFHPLSLSECLAIIEPSARRPAAVHARGTLLSLMLDSFSSLGEERLFAAAEKSVAEIFNLMRADHLALAQALILADRFDRAGGEAALGGRYPDLTAAMKGVLANHAAHLVNFFSNSMPLQDDPVPLIVLGRHMTDMEGDARCEERVRAFLPAARKLCAPDLARVTDCASFGSTLLRVAAERGYVPTDREGRSS